MKIQPNILDRPPLDKQSSRSSFRRQMSGSPAPLSPTRTMSIMNPYDTTAVRNFVNANFPGSILLEEHQVNGYFVSGPQGGFSNSCILFSNAINKVF